MSQGEEVVPDVSRSHGRAAPQQHRLAPLRQPQENGRTRDGIPYLAPEVVLLFKARSTVGKDRHDVATVLPVLDAGQRSWLQDTLKRLPPGKTAAVPRG